MALSRASVTLERFSVGESWRKFIGKAGSGDCGASDEDRLSAIMRIEACKCRSSLTELPWKSIRFRRWITV